MGLIMVDSRWPSLGEEEMRRLFPGEMISEQGESGRIAVVVRHDRRGLVVSWASTDGVEMLLYSEHERYRRVQ